MEEEGAREKIKMKISFFLKFFFVVGGPPTMLNITISLELLCQT